MLESEPYTGGQPYTMVRILQQARSAQHQCTRTINYIYNAAKDQKSDHTIIYKMFVA
jgi:hypothetical protein